MSLVRKRTYFPRPTAAEQAGIHDNSEISTTPILNCGDKLRPRSFGGAAISFRACRSLAERPSSGGNAYSTWVRHGDFLRAASEEFGVVPVGIDVSARAVEASRQAGIEAYQTLIEEAGRTGFRHFRWSPRLT